MSNSLKGNQSNPTAGLGTFAHTIVTAGEWTLRFTTTIPLGSAVQAVINLNGSAKFTIGGTADDPTPTQQSLGGAASFLAAAGDIVDLTLTSANAVDALPNAVKSVINLYMGF